LSYCLIKDKGQIQREETILHVICWKTEAAVDEMNNGRNKEVTVRMGQRNRRSSIEAGDNAGLTAESRTWTML
jgi:hypothetical protein